MPKETYFSLPDEKRMRVYQACKQEFEKYSFHDAKIMHIVKALDIPRGSFYQYFEDLTDCYFYVLSKETTELHEIFMELIKHYSLDEALERYKYLLVDELLHGERASLYRFRFLDWNYELDQAWSERMVTSFEKERKNNATIQVFKAVVHDLIYQLYSKNWDATTFIAHYDSEISVLINGINTLTKVEKQE
ncbi:MULTISPECIES: TetR/AcrR family transcriptional regulator [unclassified Lactococcus]|uniref:TetR/AcrR family transcriptional regulator n=1 Tax=unclassified Lactococcus TaxID=2643510 RepID=UPI0011C8A606|nr:MULTISPECIES: TetR/AcrR family transcriptional regulator [unclassified Lactococcus]MQW22858.1 TetR/AcrR family transcriptional regulator [Lactococcus sp. dk101]TXK44593.1 TetR/AcrR family transcriptional regulator [Lactococcus sp. dk310]TXK50446.1 TetR/AcrR family transcriptional regulator [Lactococcus sp. dk322]